MTIQCYQVGALSTNTYLVIENKKVLLIDPADISEEINKTIKDNKLEITAILLTHGHFDHIKGLPYYYRQGEMTIYCHENTIPALRDSNVNLSALVNEEISFDYPVFSWKEEQTILHIGDFQIKVFHCPGHTVGDTCYYLEKENSLFSGDTLFMGSVGRSDFPGGDHEQLINSIKNLSSYIPKKTEIFPGHGLNTILESELKNNPYLQ